MWGGCRVGWLSCGVGRSSRGIEPPLGPAVFGPQPTGRGFPPPGPIRGYLKNKERGRGSGDAQGGAFALWLNGADLGGCVARADEGVQQVIREIGWDGGEQAAAGLRVEEQGGFG